MSILKYIFYRYMISDKTRETLELMELQEINEKAKEQQQEKK
jgi:hypothetical protein